MGKTYCEGGCLYWGNHFSFMTLIVVLIIAVVLTILRYRAGRGDYYDEDD